MQKNKLKFQYPKNIKLKNDKRELCPVEQLLLAIPVDTYKYVISKKLITKIRKNKEIGYMFPEKYDIDVNKESLFWKCQVKIPMVEYDEYIKNIKLVNIIDEKNTIQEDFYNQELIEINRNKQKQELIGINRNNKYN